MRSFYIGTLSYSSIHRISPYSLFGSSTVEEEQNSSDLLRPPKQEFSDDKKVGFRDEEVCACCYL